MAGTIQTFDPTAWDSRIDILDSKYLLRIAMEGASAVGQAAADGVLARLCARRMDERFDFLVQARTTAAETFAVAELMTARGVPFAAATMRIITADVNVSGDAATETGYAKYIFTVSGGSTPIIRSGGVLTATPATMQDSAFYQAMAGAGLAATPALTCVAGAGTVTINVVSAEAEILNWTVRIGVGKALPLILGV